MENRFKLPEQALFTTKEETRQLGEEGERLRGELEAEQQCKTGFLRTCWRSRMVVWVVSAWVVILGVLLSFASIVFLLAEWEGWRQHKRALKGLLRILDMEMVENEHLLRIFDEHPECISWACERSLHSKAWEETKTTLALLLRRNKHFDTIASYYEKVQAVERARKNELSSSEEAGFQSLVTGLREDAEDSEKYEHQRMVKQVRVLLEMSDIARGHNRKHGCVSNNAL